MGSRPFCYGHVSGEMKRCGLGLDWVDWRTGQEGNERKWVGETEGRKVDTTELLFFQWYVEGRLEVVKIAFPRFYGHHSGKRVHVI